jgi:hypothetical protein
LISLRVAASNFRVGFLPTHLCCSLIRWMELRHDAPAGIKADAKPKKNFAVI